MILCPLSEFSRYFALHPLFPETARFLDGPGLAELPEGRTEIRGDQLFANVTPRARTRPAAEALLESHRDHIDVQLILAGQDTLGWAPLATCAQEAGPYDPVKDVVHYREPPQQYFQVRTGHLAIVFPEDAHAPLVGDGGTIHKIVVKVRLN